MIRRLALPLAALALAATSLSCAVTGGGESPGPGTAYVSRSMPAARAALPPAFRVFYDELAEHGDWVLIEPYGFVFRPRVNFVAWRPYLDGWWQPSDHYGWVWISDEPFGWVTYHYGNWFWDRFQGWVWAPGYDWGPAWVAWVSADDWYGWAPLGPAGYDDYGRWPGGVFTYVPARALAATGLDRAPQFVTTVAPKAASLEPVLDLGNEDGVAFPRGPSFERIARAMNARVEPAPLTLARPTLEGAGRVPRNDGSFVLALSRRVLDAGEREWVAAREGRMAPVPPPSLPRKPVWREPGRPPKPAAEPAGKPTGDAPADTAAARPAPKRTEADDRGKAEPADTAAVDKRPAVRPGGKPAPGSGAPRGKPRPAERDSSR